MANIKDTILSVLDKIQTVEFTNNSGQTKPVYTAIFNNQIDLLIDGENYPFNLPAVFVETVQVGNTPTLTYGIVGVDFIFRIHIVHEQIDAGDGAMDQNLDVFDLRKHVIYALTNYEPTACSALQLFSQEMDYTHTNVYHYILEFIGHVVDDSGSKYPTLQSVPVANLVLNDGYAPIEILEVGYSGTTLTVKYKLIAETQQVKFTLPVAGTVSAGTRQPGTHTFTKTSYSLTTGEYLLTAQAVTKGFTTPAYKFYVS